MKNRFRSTLRRGGGNIAAECKILGGYSPLTERKKREEKNCLERRQLVRPFKRSQPARMCTHERFAPREKRDTDQNRDLFCVPVVFVSLFTKKPCVLFSKERCFPNRHCDRKCTNDISSRLFATFITLPDLRQSDERRFEHRPCCR